MKGLKQEGAWHVEGIASRLVWQRMNGQLEKELRGKVRRMGAEGGDRPRWASRPLEGLQLLFQGDGELLESSEQMIAMI